MHKCDNLLAILAELTQDAQQIDNDSIQALGDAILAAKRVFVAGAGRSGFAARAFSISSCTWAFRSGLSVSQPPLPYSRVIC